MKSTNKTLLALASVSLIIFATTLWSLRVYDGWTHLELGAGNYGQEGHTKVSQQKTVLMQLEATDKPNYVDKLPEKDIKPYQPEQQFAVLFSTLDQLVATKGPKGVFHVNDLIDAYAISASEALKNYANQKGYHKVTIEVVPGDYEFLDPEQHLKAYKLKKYESVHLKNPEISLYSYKLDGDEVLFNDQSRTKARILLQKLANYSSTGLTFFPVLKPNFIPDEEIEEFASNESFYKPEHSWQPAPYVFPTGESFADKYAAVYFIPQNFAVEDRG